jgi:hypothetical protein
LARFEANSAAKKPKGRVMAHPLLRDRSGDLVMTYRAVAASLVLAAMLGTSWESEAATSKARLRAVAAPVGTDARVRAALSEALERELEAAGLGPSLSDYSVAPSLVQLRRYVKAEGQRLEWVCVVELTLLDASQSVVASVRGNAATSQGAARETLDAAAHAAVARLPEALQALGGARKRAEKVAQR